MSMLLVAVLILMPFGTSLQKNATSPPPFSQRELNGFLLGQNTEVLEKHFKRTSDEKKTGADGWTYWVYAQGEGYMLFESRDDQPNRLASIQITGNESTQMRNFLGLRLGDKEEKVLQGIGKPSQKTLVPELGWHLLTYEGRNYSFEIDESGRLSSIKIIGWEGFRTDPTEFDIELSHFLKALSSGNPDDCMDWLAADLESYRANRVVTFAAAARNDLADPRSELALLLFDKKQGLVPALADGLPDADSQMRLRLGHPPLNVFKFPAGKMLKELVFTFEAGRWRLYEVAFGEQPTRWARHFPHRSVRGLTTATHSH